MKKNICKVAFIFVVLSCLLFSCSPGVDTPQLPLQPFEVSDVTRNAYRPVYQPKDSADTVFWDDFEGNSLTARNNWVYENVELTSLDEIRKFESENNPDYPGYKTRFGNEDSKVVLLSTNFRTTSYLILFFDNLSDSYQLSFRYSITAVKDTVFTIYRNGDKNQYCYKSTLTENTQDRERKILSISIPSGTSSITFEVENATNMYYPSLRNGFIIDDISLVRDRVSSIFIAPKTNQKTYVDCSVGENVLVSAYPIRADGTIVSGEIIDFNSANGDVVKLNDTVYEGYWSYYFVPSATGTAKITASCNGVTAESGEITVYADKFSENDGASTIAGVTYKGMLTDNGTDLSSQTRIYLDYNAKIEFEYPKTNKVTADGFVRLKGTLTPSTLEKGGNATKVVILVKNKTNNINDVIQTTYIVDKDFDLRVWLPFGAAHEILVCAADVSYRTYGDNCEGDYYRWQYYPCYTIEASNTHKHTDVDSGSSDGRYVYPSFDCQSDSYLIQNITNEVLSVLPPSASDLVKFQAIHDYIALNYYYDYLSIDKYKENRKKQDAVSVVNNGTCVCAGYTSLTAAMARYAGIPARYVTSEKINHAWNHVRIDGSWYFCDTTWDDPDKDPNSTNVYYNYFLLTDFSGIKNDHENDWIIEARTVEPQYFQEPELPFLLRDGNWF